MDKCTLLPGELAIRNECGDWAALAKSFALEGVVKAQEQQKKVEEWVERIREYERGQVGHGETEGSISNVRTQTRKTRKGRKGVSLRREDAPPTPQLPPIDSKKDKFRGPRQPGGTSSVVLSSSTKRVRVVPSLPTMRSFATELSLPPSHAAVRDAGARRALVETIQAKWEEGWAEGIGQLVRRRGLARTSWRNGIVRVVRFAEVDELKLGESVDDEEAFGDTERYRRGFVYEGSYTLSCRNRHV
ncbi:hypothetical protein E1B28_001691 [Marasmius oreades]|uniref:Uncharacterized protein n=1 Tax=Marasmius oreades TaxID=181124 RepID=A0A9P7V3Z5_9AGAR|nr:uncharacterized protein E1B28_001691 [Marasmius oreades]KAG7099890.1 hypothetical protein E1B28_001691 [Marasmius oreades]